nr:50S ribosomal protein L3P [uncultured archaeon]
MSHFLVVDNRPNSLSKGELVSMPVTVIECPPLKVASVRLYSGSVNGLRLLKEISGKVDKEFGRKAPLPKKEAAAVSGVDVSSVVDVRVVVYTQPKLTGIGRVKPEVFEVPVGGKTVDEQAVWRSAQAAQVREDEARPWLSGQLVQPEDVECCTCRPNGFSPEA